MSQSPPPRPNKPRGSFSYGAAKVALAAPIIAIVLGLFTQPLEKASPIAGLIMGGLNILLLLLGFLASIAALAAIPRLGRSGLLVRGLAGLLLNGLFLAAVVYLLLFLRNLNIDSRLQGTWEARDARLVTQHLSLQPDHHFQLEFSGPGGTATTAGTWRSAWNAHDTRFYLLLTPDPASHALSSPNASAIALPIDETSDGHFTVTDSGHPLIYNKVP
jgi:hypothetical protein